MQPQHQLPPSVLTPLQASVVGSVIAVDDHGSSSAPTLAQSEVSSPAQEQVPEPNPEPNEDPAEEPAQKQDPEPDSNKDSVAETATEPDSNKDLAAKPVEPVRKPTPGPEPELASVADSRIIHGLLPSSPLPQQPVPTLTSAALHTPPPLPARTPLHHLVNYKAKKPSFILMR